jgi:hypothetical protein
MSKKLGSARHDTLAVTFFVVVGTGTQHLTMSRASALPCEDFSIVAKFTSSVALDDAFAK